MNVSLLGFTVWNFFSVGIRGLVRLYMNLIIKVTINDNNIDHDDDQRMKNDNY